MSTAQKLQFKQYNSTLLTNILSSHFVYRNYEKLPQLEIISLSISTRNLKKIHFWYLYLVSMQKPRIKKFHFSWKVHIQKSNIIQPKKKSIIWEECIKKKKSLFSLYRFVWFILYGTSFRKKNSKIPRKRYRYYNSIGHLKPSSISFTSTQQLFS